MEPTTNTKKQSVINRSAVKAYALEVSKTHRAGKFTRVSEEFLIQVEADVEMTIRALEPEIHDLPGQIITGEAIRRMKNRLNDRAHTLIRRRVMRHPSLGVTLKD